MASWTTMHTIAAGAAACLVIAAGVTAISDRDDTPSHGIGLAAQAQQAQAEQPLNYSRGIGPAPAAGRDQLVAVRVRPTLDLASWAQGPMGDGRAGEQYLQIDTNYTTNVYSPPTCIAFEYRPGPTGWAGSYWLNHEDDWGRSPGTNLSEYSRVVFYARGKYGNERLEFKAGGVDATRLPGVQYKDSFAASLGKVTLGRDWQRFSLDLTGLNLQSVVGGFAWVATLEDNPQGVTFYIDDVRYE